MARTVQKAMSELRKQIEKMPNKYLPVLIIDAEEAEYIKEQLEKEHDKQGLRKIRFSNGDIKMVHVSTVIIVDDI